jgi:hypothetical protein
VPAGQSTVIVGGGGGGSGGVALAGHVVMHVLGPQRFLPSISGQSHSPGLQRRLCWSPTVIRFPEQGGIRVGVHVVTGGFFGFLGISTPTQDSDPAGRSKGPLTATVPIAAQL